MRLFLTPLGLFTLLASCQLHAQKPAPHHTPTPPKATTTTELPVTRVSLYKNGVGFFEHSGRVDDTQTVTIDFTTSQLNDVLQSLTAIDLQGGRITGAGYNSTTPLDQQLKTLPLDLSANPNDVDFFTAIRGARVEVHGPGGSLTGRILSIDVRPPAKSASDDATPGPERRFLTVVADAGDVRTFELTPATDVRLLDTTLKTDVNRYLELLAGTRNAGLRHLNIEDRGTGSRDLRISYISEVPVWKSTYRILFTDPTATTASTGTATAGTATVQGWSVVDNTTGSDWTDVHLSLIAGAPQSFIQPLSTPYYTRRPEIPLPSEAQLTPQTHDSGEAENKVSNGASATTDGAIITAPEMQQLSIEGRDVSQLLRTQPGLAQAAAPKAANGYVGGGLESLGRPAAPPAVPASYQNFANQSYGGNTTTSAFDDYFEYALTDPITIRKNESALVPILQTRLPMERVTLWSDRDPVALRALWLTNASTLTLDRGSFSIVENGNFGGEGLLDPIHPGERRLLSYAADQAVRVTTSGFHNSSRITQLRISRGVLTETSIDVSERTYDVHNAAPEPRTVIVEHSLQPGYTLDSDPKPVETVPTGNGPNSGQTDRFRVLTKAGETVHLHVGERHTGYQYIRLVDRTEDQIVLLIRNSKASPAALAALQPVFDAYHVLAGIDTQIGNRQTEIKNIIADQDRLRENLKALRGTPEEKALATRYTGELNSQEDRLATLRKEIADLQTQRVAADSDFHAKLESATFEEAL